MNTLQNSGLSMLSVITGIEFILIAGLGVLIFLFWKKMPKNCDVNLELKRLMKKVHLISVRALKSNILDESLPPLDRMHDLMEFIVADQNGNTIEKAVTSLLLPHRQMCLSFLNNYKIDSSEILNIENYNKTLDKIKRILSS